MMYFAGGVHEEVEEVTRQQHPPVPEIAVPPETRRRWTAHEKDRIVRQHLRDGVPVADLAERTGAAPGLIHTWIKLALERLDLALDDRRPQASQQTRAVARKDARIRQLRG